MLATCHFDHISASCTPSSVIPAGCPPQFLAENPSSASAFMSSQDASSTASAPSPPALHAHCRTEPAADARASDVSRKLFPEKDRLTQAKLFEKHRSESLSKSSFAFLPCARGRTHAPLASQGGRPKGRTADTQGGQSCPNSRKKPSRRRRSFSSGADTRSSRATGNPKA